MTTRWQAAFCVATALLTSRMAAATNVSGAITTNTTWTVAGSPYIVTATVTVNPGVTLTIQPGVTVKASGSSAIEIQGTLNALGTSVSPISITANTANPVKGSWLYLRLQSGASSSQLAYVSIAYGGGGASSPASLRIEGSSPTLDHVTVTQGRNRGCEISGATAAPTITNSTFSNNTNYGLNVTSGASVTLSGSAFTGNTTYGIGAEPGTQFLDLSGLTFSTNTTGNGVGYRGGTISSATSWKAGATWFVTAPVTVGFGTTLTVDPGTTVKMTGSTSIDVAGTVSALGTAGAPITITSSIASPVKGSWLYLRLQSTASASQLTYVSIAYGGEGASSPATLRIEGSSPTLDHVTVTQGRNRGCEVSGATAAPTITNSTFSNNTNYGLNLTTGASATVSGSTFSSNTTYGIGAEPGTSLLDLAGLTFSGNTSGDGIGYRGGTISGLETWKSGATWFITASVTVDSAGSLTVEPGVTAKMSALFFEVQGTLTALGTATNPIVFTTRSATPTKGAWTHLRLASCNPTSQLRYLTVAYAGGGTSQIAALRIEGCSPTLDHVGVNNSATKGLYAAQGAAITNANGSFTNNTTGGASTDGTSTIDARLSYWGASNGPSGSGPGSGQSVSAGILFEPWLAAAPSPTQFLTSATEKNHWFNPSLSIFTKLDFMTALAGNWTVSYLNSGGQTVRTFTGSGSSGSVTWDGKNASGVAQPNGTYTLQADSTASTGEVATQARGIVVIDSTRQLSITGVAVDYPFFSPNADGIQDQTTLGAQFNFDDVAWTVDVRQGTNPPVRSYGGTGSGISLPWDGKDSGAAVVPDALYTLQIGASAGTATANAQANATVDDIFPVAVVTSPVPGTLSNVYQAGLLDVPVVGTTSDLNLQSWTLDYGAGASPSAWTQIATGTTSQTAAQLGIWATGALVNGPYTLRLRALDKAGNQSAPAALYTIGNFTVAQSVEQFSPTAGQTVTYTSAVPFALSETLVLKNQTGQTVRTLVSDANRNAGSFPDAWNGKNDAAVFVPDGPYFYVATVTDGTHSLTWDLSQQYFTEPFLYNDGLFIQPFDPFNNSPMTFTYNFNRTGRIHIGFAPSPPVMPNCDPPQFCLVDGLYQESGPHTVYWAGVDNNGLLRGEAKTVAVVSTRKDFSKNAVVIYGAKAPLTGIEVTPPVFGPAVGTQTVEFDFSTYQSQPADISIAYQNQSSLATLRTISLPQHTPGHVSAIWDGRADNGMLVAPGRYTVTVTVTDALGNQSRGQILTLIQY